MKTLLAIGDNGDWDSFLKFYRNKGLFKKMLLRGKEMWPCGEFIEFERDFRENDKGFRSYPIDRFLRALK